MKNEASLWLVLPLAAVGAHSFSSSSSSSSSCFFLVACLPLLCFSVGGPPRLCLLSLSGVSLSPLVSQGQNGRRLLSCPRQRRYVSWSAVVADNMRPRCTLQHFSCNVVKRAKQHPPSLCGVSHSPCRWHHILNSPSSSLLPSLRTEMLTKIAGSWFCFQFVPPKNTKGQNSPPSLPYCFLTLRTVFSDLEISHTWNFELRLKSCSSSKLLVFTTRVRW